MTQQLNILQSIGIVWLLAPIKDFCTWPFIWENKNAHESVTVWQLSLLLLFWSIVFSCLAENKTLPDIAFFYLHMHLQGVIWNSKFLIWINGRFATWWLFGTFQFVLMSGFYVQEGGSSVKRFSSNFPAPLTAWQSMLLVFCIAFSQVYSCVFV